MRTSTFLLTAILSAGALAHPYHHVHAKRDGNTKLVSSHVEGNKLIEEYETVHVEVVDPDGTKHDTVVNAPKPAAPAPQPEKKVVTVEKPEADAETKPKTEAKPKPAPAPAKPAQPVKAKVEQPKQPQADADKKVTPAAPTESKPAKSDDDSKSSGTCAQQDTVGDLKAFQGTPCSGGKTLIDTFNDMRAEWNPSLKSNPYKWSAKLAGNACQTATTSEQQATVMAHRLFAGSNGQCIAERLQGQNDNGFSSFGKALEMWMCEIEQGFCKEKTSGVGDDPTGHAKIIADTSFSNVGCCFMWGNNDPNASMGMWTCDFGNE